MKNNSLESQMDQWYMCALHSVQDYYHTRKFRPQVSFGTVKDVEMGDGEVLRRIEYVMSSDDIGADLNLVVFTRLDGDHREIVECYASVSDGKRMIEEISQPDTLIHRMASVAVSQY